MPKVPLTATRDFTYMTRRLTAGDPFEARNPLEAKILTRVRKVAEVPGATSGRTPENTRPTPPQGVAEEVSQYAPSPEIDAALNAEPKAAPKKAAAKPKAGTKARAKKAAKKA